MLNRIYHQKEAISMLDKKQYDNAMDLERQEQISYLADYLADFAKRHANIRDMQVNRTPDPELIDYLRNIPISRGGRPAKEVAEELVDKVLVNSLLLQHPRCFSFVNCAVSPYSLAGSVLTEIFNPNAGGYMLAPAACEIEEKLIRWMGGLAGYPQDTCGGLFVSGGSMANMTALIAARESRLAETEYPIGVAYLSDQTHSSVVKGLRLIGFRKDQIVVIPTDDDFKMRTDLLEAAVAADLAAGKKPFVVVGTIGTTNTGSIDPLNAIADVCEKYNLWFHIDGAYGGSILISDIYRNYAKGVERSDSLSWDTHKWALQTYSCSSIIARDRKTLVNAFVEHPEYLADVITEEHVDGWDLGMEMSRPHRALKLWFTIQAMGTDLLADVIDFTFHNAKQCEYRLRSYPNWEIVSKPMCGAINFRYVPEGWSEEQVEQLNLDISKRIDADGFAYIVTSVLKGKRVLRMCMLSSSTTTEDVIETVDYLDKIARELAGIG